MPMNSGTNFVKSFMLTRKLSQQTAAKAFGSNPPTTATWTCADCNGVNLARKETCRCGAKKPKSA